MDTCAPADGRNLSAFVAGVPSTPSRVRVACRGEVASAGRGIRGMLAAGLRLRANGRAAVNEHGGKCICNTATYNNKLFAMMLRVADIEYLVFSGGGQRGFAYVGALRALRALGLDVWTEGWPRRRRLKGTGGTSIGALMAALVAVGYNAEELAVEVLSMPLEALVQLNVGTLVTAHGLDTGDVLERFIDGMLARKLGGKLGVTFGELAVLTGVSLMVVVHDLVEDKALYLDAGNAPTLRVATAVCMSMALPPLFAPHKLWRRTSPDETSVQYAATKEGFAYMPPLHVELEDGHVLEVHPTLEQLTVIDGGCADNFPVSRFPASRTLGLRVTWEKSAPELKSRVSYFARLVYCCLSRCEAAQWATLLTAAHRAHTVSIDVDMPAVHLHMSTAAKRQLFAAGEGAVVAAFAFAGGDQELEEGAGDEEDVDGSGSGAAQPVAADIHRRNVFGDGGGGGVADVDHTT